MKRPHRFAYAAGTVGLMAATGFAADFPSQIQWNTAVHDGYLNERANWTNAEAVPGNGQTQTFNLDGKSGAYVVRVPAGTTLEQQAHFYMVNQPVDTTFTIDTTGARYVQMPAGYLSNWQAFGFYTVGTTHWCNFEGVSTSGGYPVCSLDDAVLEVRRTSDQRIVELKRGTWNCYDPIPDGSKAQCTFMFGNSGDWAHAYFGEGSQFKAYGITLRGGTIHITGGAHEARSVVTLGNAYGYNPVLDISGGSFGVSNTVQVGAANQAKSSTLDVHGTGHLAANAVSVGCTGGVNLPRVFFRDDATATLGNLFIGYAQTADPARVELSNNAAVVANGMYVGAAANATADLVLTDRSRLVAPNGFCVGIGDGSLNKDGITATVLVEGEATVESRNTIRLGGRTGSGAVTMTGNATLTAASGGLSIGQHGTLTLDGHAVHNQNSWMTVEGDGALFTVGGNATFKQRSTLEIKQNGRMVIADGAAYESDHANTRSITINNGTLELQGGTSQFDRFNVSGAEGNTTVSTMLVSGGTHEGRMDTSGSYVGLTVGFAKSHSLYEQTGGVVRYPRIGRVGYYTTGSGSAILRMKGGVMEITPENGTSGSAVMNVSDSKDSKGRIELLGGELICQAVRGWTGAACKEGTGFAQLYANGGTVKGGLTAFGTLLETFDEAVLGEKGLTIDTNDKTLTVNQAFADENAGTGLFVKTGAGTLEASVVSTHGVTAVANGTFRPKVEQFGKELVVTNGAEFALTANGRTSYTVDSLTVGSETSRGTLLLDPGDVIVVNGDNAVHFQNALLSCDAVATTLGTYTFFRCKGTVDLAAFDELTLKNMVGAYDYSWQTAMDGNDTLVQLVVGGRTVTSSEWQGSAGSDWHTPENWNPSGVPTASVSATFPATASTKSITWTDRADAYAVNVVGGTYTMGSGDEVLSANQINVANGELTVNAGLLPAGRFSCDIQTGGKLVLNGQLSENLGATDLQKVGSGLLELTTAQEVWTGDWSFKGGTVVSKVAGSLGPSSTIGSLLVLGASTLAFTDVPQQVMRNLTLEPGEGRLALIRNDVDTEICGKVMSSSGGFVKRGGGTLTLTLPSGNNQITADDLGHAVNVDPQAALAFDASGDTPTTVSGFCALSVLEGRLKVVGQGQNADDTLFSQKNKGTLGANFNAQFNPELELHGVTMNQGGAGHHFYIGGTIPAATAATHPTLTLLDGTKFNTDTLKLGAFGHQSGSTLLVEPVLAITNASSVASWALLCGVGGDERLQPRLLIGAGGQMKVNTSGNSGILLQGALRGEVADGGVLESPSANCNGFYFNQYGHCRLLFTRGGRLRVPKFSAHPYNQTAQETEIVFDGGVLEFTAPRDSLVAGPAKRRLVMRGAGGEINCATGRHVLSLPITGGAGFRKTGAGELYLPQAMAYGDKVTNRVEGLVIAGCTGTVTVAEGALTLEAGAAATNLAVAVEAGAELRVAGGQTLGALSGTGTIAASAVRSTPGKAQTVAVDAAATAPALVATITLPYDEQFAQTRQPPAAVPTFSGVALGAMRVDFQVPSTGHYPFNVEIPVARLADGATAASLASWKGVNCGDGGRAEFTQRDGVVYAVICSPGTLIIFR